MCQVGAFGKVIAQQAVGVLVGAALATASVPRKRTHAGAGGAVICWCSESSLPCPTSASARRWGARAPSARRRRRACLGGCSPGRHVDQDHEAGYALDQSADRPTVRASMMQSPAQCPTCTRSSTSAGRSAIVVISVSRPRRSSPRTRNGGVVDAAVSFAGRIKRPSRPEHPVRPGPRRGPVHPAHPERPGPHRGRSHPAARAPWAPPWPVAPCGPFAP